MFHKSVCVRLEAVTGGSKRVSTLQEEPYNKKIDGRSKHTALVAVAISSKALQSLGWEGNKIFPAILSYPEQKRLFPWIKDQSIWKRIAIYFHEGPCSHL